MSSTLDPAKLKVVELRSELAARNLDTKGNKAVLVKRLKDALDEEEAEGGDTSSAKVDTSAVEEAEQGEEENEAPPDKNESIEQPEISNKMETEEEEPIPEEDKPQVKVEETSATSEENGEKPKVDETEEKKSRLSSEEGKEIVKDDSDVKKEHSTEVKSEEPEKRGEKRRRSSPSPERPHQRKRSKSPVKEDEPILDNDKVQLSWYDSDLHLQLDKESFLSAKPFNEGAFGYAWAGARTNYGVSTGKVCYEVKITEELKWEDFSTLKDRPKGRDAYKTDHRKTSPKKGHTKEGEKKTSDEKSDDKKAEEEVKKPSEENGDADKETTESTEAKVEDVATEVKTETDEAKTEKSDTEEAKEDDKEKSEEKPKDEPMETEEKMNETEKPAEKVPTHLIRIGWSLVDTELLLGETKHSYGYESTGKFVTDKQFQEYGVQFAVGDVVGAFVSIDDNVTLTYTVNGVAQPVAVTVPRSEFPENFALFPHVSTRNYAFEVNIGQKEEPFFPAPAELQDYAFLDKVEEKVSGPERPINRTDCEIILMCGLPACGKTHWVREHLKNNPDKRYLVIGNTQLLEKMTVNGRPLKSAFKGRWSLLMDRLQRCLNKLLELASQRRRNYIIDQTNVFPSAQRRKLRPFEGFKRKAVVLVVSDEEQTKRLSLQQEAQDGKEVPESTILEMKAIITLPEKSEWLDEVEFVDLDETAAKEMVQKYNKDGKSAGYGTGQKRIPRKDWQRKNDLKYKSYRDRNYHNRYDNRNWNNRPSGNWNRDRREPARHSVGGGRDWRPRDGRSHGDTRQSGSYRRSSQGGGNRNSQVWQSYGQGGGWNQQTFGGHHGSQWGGSGQGSGQYNQWKYGGGQGAQGYGNWNYYGQYAQNWGREQSGANPTGTTTQQQGYTDQNWAQYAQQYAQQSGQQTDDHQY